MPSRWRARKALLMLRSAPKERVSKHGDRSPFETPPSAAPQDEECDPLLDAAVRALALSQTLIVMPAKAGIQ
jgi:hypothetical protein